MSISQSFFMDISKLSVYQQGELIKELSKHITESRWELIQKVIAERTQHVTLVLEDIYQSHNAAAVIRSCDGFGIQDLHVIEKRNKLLLDNTTVAKGADKWLTFHYYNNPLQNNTEVCIRSLKAKGYRIGATALGKHAITLEEIDLAQPVAIMIGTEKEGLSEEAYQLADFCIELPMYGFTQSYNLSVCAAIILYTLTTKLRNSEIKWRLTEEAKREVLLLWLQRCVMHWEVVAERFFQKQKVDI